jgi:hypothetical protein
MIRARVLITLKPSDIAWVTLAVGVITYDMSVSEEELLSTACGRYVERRPWLTRSIIVLTAAHLARWLPETVDPFHIAAERRPWRRDSCAKQRL